MKKTFRSRVRKMISLFLFHSKIGGKIKDLIMWPIATRLLGADYTETITLHGGGLFLCDMSDIVGRYVLFYGEYLPCVWETGTMNFFTQRIKQSKQVVIAGAHIGYTLFHAARALPSDGQIHSFEPVSYLYQIAETNARYMGPNVHIEKKALGAEPGVLNIHIDGVRSSFIDSVKFKGMGTEPVEIITIDDYAKEHKIEHIDFIFLDVEGFELNALQGSRQSILSGENPPEIIFEIIIKNGSMSSDVCDYLKQFGYRFYVIEDDYGLEHPLVDMPISLKSFDTYQPSGSHQRYLNVFATVKSI